MQASNLKRGKFNKDALKRTMSYIFKDYKWQMLLVVIMIVVSAIALVQGTLFQQKLIDDYIMPMIGDANPDWSGLAKALGQLAVILLVGGVFCSWAYNQIMVFIAQGTMDKLRKELFDHMQTLPVKYFDTHKHGDIMSVYTNDVDTMRQMIGQSIPQVINSSITIVVTFISMIRMNLILTVLSVIMIIFTLLGTAKSASASRRYFVKQQKDLGRENGYIEEMMNGQKVVKVFCHEDKSVEQFRSINEDLRDSASKANIYANIIMPMNANMGNLSYVLIAIAGAYMALHGLGGLTLGALVSFLTLNRNFSRPVTQISQQANSIVTATAGAERIFTMMDEPSETDEGYVTLVRARENADGSLTETNERTGTWAWKHYHKADGTTEYRKLEGKITMDHVDFSYDGKHQVLYDVTLYGMPGQKIAFVGSTGAGKTTITNLINRFYDIADGKIRYDDININKIKKSDLRRSLGIVLQDTHLFTGTIMDNIRYGRLDATDEECIAAARLANADGFIRRLPNGYQTVIKGDGGSLSQGERQLLAIARAAVADPPVMILDEATSSIDTRTESMVQKGMDALMNGRTTFVIAHRLSTVKNSDCIMVLEHGHIIERGSHDELIAKKGRYYQLYTGNQIGE